MTKDKAKCCRSWDAQTTFTISKQKLIINYANLHLDLLDAQEFKFKFYIKKIIVVEIIKNVLMNEYVTAIATAAVVSSTASFPLYTMWNVSKHGVFSGLYFPIFGLNTEICKTLSGSKNKKCFGKFTFLIVSETWLL